MKTASTWDAIPNEGKQGSTSDGFILSCTGKGGGEQGVGRRAKRTRQEKSSMYKPGPRSYLTGEQKRGTIGKEAKKKETGNQSANCVGKEREQEIGATIDLIPKKANRLKFPSAGRSTKLRTWKPKKGQPEAPELCNGTKTTKKFVAYCSVGKRGNALEGCGFGGKKKRNRYSRTVPGIPS